MLAAISIVLVLLAAWYAIESLKKPGIGLALGLSLFTYEQVLQQGNAFLLQRGSLINLAVAFIIVLCVVRNLLEGRIKVNRLPRTVICVLLLYVLVFFSTTWSVQPKTSYHWLKTFLPYVVLFTFLCPLCVPRAKDLIDFTNCMLVMGLFVGLGLAFSSFGHRGVVLTVIDGRAVEGNPLASGTYGGYLSIIAIFSLYGDNRKSLKFSLKLLVAALGIYTVYRSGSRGQLIAVILSVMFWLPIIAKVAAKRSTVIALVLATLVLVAFAYLVGNSDLAFRWNSEGLRDSTYGRVNGGAVLVTTMFACWPGKLDFWSRLRKLLSTDWLVSPHGAA